MCLLNKLIATRTTSTLEGLMHSKEYTSKISISGLALQGHSATAQEKLMHGLLGVMLVEVRDGCPNLLNPGTHVM